MLRPVLALSLALLLLASPAVRADALSDFYRGRTINIVIGFGAGGGYDIYARLVAQHLGRHIPGNPSFVAQNMPGAGGRLAAEYVYNVAVQDGSVLGILPAALVTDKLLGPEERYQPEKFTWIARLNDFQAVTIVWHTSPVQNIAQAKEREIVLAASSPLNLSAKLPIALNRMVGTKFKVISGYTTDMVLAMQRGETHGAGGTSWEPLKVTHGHLLREKLIHILYAQSIERGRDLPEVPAIVEFATNDEDRQVLRLFGSQSDLGRTIVAGPGVPRDRGLALRDGVAALVKDRAFLGDAEKLGIEIGYMPGEAVAALVTSLMSASPAVIARARAVTAN